jgi:predicted O-methyltransferase YrrM
MAKALIHLIRYKIGLDQAQSQTTQAERDAVAKYASGKMRAAEIGVFEGVTTGVIAKALSDQGELFAIDPFIVGRVGICWGKPIARSETFRRNPKCSIRFIEAFSHVASEQIDGTFDFVFIDGDHSLTGIKQDWSDWSARIRPQGFIALHDTVVPAHNPRVAQLGSHQYFVSHIQHDQRFEVLEQIDSLSVLRLRS